jgi:hypothetical protein
MLRVTIGAFKRYHSKASEHYRTRMMKCTLTLQGRVSWTLTVAGSIPFTLPNVASSSYSQPCSHNPPLSIRSTGVVGGLPWASHFSCKLPLSYWPFSHITACLVTVWWVRAGHQYLWPWSLQFYTVPSHHEFYPDYFFAHIFHIWFVPSCRGPGAKNMESDHLLGNQVIRTMLEGPSTVTCCSTGR